MRERPRKPCATISASKWWPSPLTSTSSQSRPRAIADLIDSGVTMSLSSQRYPSMPKLVACCEHRKRQRRESDGRRRDEGERDRRGDVGEAEEAVTKPVDHIKERVG